MTVGGIVRRWCSDLAGSRFVLVLLAVPCVLLLSACEVEVTEVLRRIRSTDDWEVAARVVYNPEALQLMSEDLQSSRALPPSLEDPASWYEPAVAAVLRHGAWQYGFTGGENFLTLEDRMSGYVVIPEGAPLPGYTLFPVPQSFIRQDLVRLFNLEGSGWSAYNVGDLRGVEFKVVLDVARLERFCSRPEEYGGSLRQCRIPSLLRFGTVWELESLDGYDGANVDVVLPVPDGEWDGWRQSYGEDLWDQVKLGVAVDLGDATVVWSNADRRGEVGVHVWSWHPEDERTHTQRASLVMSGGWLFQTGSGEAATPYLIVEDSQVMATVLGLSEEGKLLLAEAGWEVTALEGQATSLRFVFSDNPGVYWWDGLWEVGWGPTVLRAAPFMRSGLVPTTTVPVTTTVPTTTTTTLPPDPGPPLRDISAPPPTSVPSLTDRAESLHPAVWGLMVGGMVLVILMLAGRAWDKLRFWRAGSET